MGDMLCAQVTCLVGGIGMGFWVCMTPIWASIGSRVHGLLYSKSEGGSLGFGDNFLFAHVFAYTADIAGLGEVGFLGDSSLPQVYAL
jgi:hypothetical protein